MIPLYTPHVRDSAADRGDRRPDHRAALASGGPAAPGLDAGGNGPGRLALAGHTLRLEALLCHSDRRGWGLAGRLDGIDAAHLCGAGPALGGHAAALAPAREPVEPL